MSDLPDDEIIGRIMDKAAKADRRALFAALQAAVGELIDTHHDPLGRRRPRQPFCIVEQALDRGAPFGSPEHLAELAAESRDG